MDDFDQRGTIALARRLYLHLRSESPITAEDIGRLVEGMEEMDRERTNLLAALTLSGIPAQAQGDPATTPPLRISVRRAREIMENIRCVK